MRNNMFHIWKSETTKKNESISLRHQHNTHELLLVLDGIITMHIGDKQYNITAGTLMFISNLEMHDLYPINLPYVRMGIHVSSDILFKATNNWQLSSIFINREEKFCHMMDCKEFLSEIRLRFEDMYREYKEDQIFSKEYNTFALGQLLILLYRHRPNNFPIIQNDIDMTILNVREYLETHFKQDISVKELASKFFLNDAYLIRKFKQITSYTPKKYLMLCRLAESRSLLLGSEISIAVVAELAGFSDSNSFIRFFKKEMGITPGEFRKRRSTYNK